VPHNRTSRKPEILIALSRGGRPSLQAQIQESIRAAIREGRLRPGSQVPATRTLAADLGVSRGVVVEAYEQLVAEGYLIASGRSLTRVAAGRHGARVPPPIEPPPDAIEFDFRPGEPDVRSFPHQAWSRAARRAMQTLAARHLGYGQAQGAPELRRALADYLARARGVVG
jgi:GntR family transcriptional regulator/MocR family aminotransferase